MHASTSTWTSAVPRWVTYLHNNLRKWLPIGNQTKKVFLRVPGSLRLKNWRKKELSISVKTLSSCTKGIHGLSMQDAVLRRAPNRKFNPIQRWYTRVFMEGRNSNLSQRGKDCNSSMSKLWHCLIYVRKIDSTFRKCPAGIRLRASDGQCLIVRSINEEHNHELSKVCNIQIPILIF